MTAFSLKMIAVLTMLIDHIGAVFFPQYIAFRIIGRIAFPIFAFFVAEGARKTKSIEKYMGKMLLFAILTEIPFDLAFHRRLFDISGQNVMWTFFVALLGIAISRKIMSWYNSRIRTSFAGNEIKSHDQESYLLLLLLMGPMMGLAYYLQTDYDWYGVAMVYLFYLLYKKKAIKFFAVAGLTILYSALYTLHFGYFFWAQYLQCCCIISFLFLFFYKGEQGKKWKYFFYFFYPMHLLLLYFISIVW